MDGEIQIRVGSWTRMSVLAADVRRAVFIVEQGIPESEEWDETDPQAVHWVALLDGEAVGCARLSREGKIGRMAVLAGYRGRGIGQRLLQACVDYAAERAFPEVRLSAQQHALSFYEKQGFTAVGPPHEEVGIAHQWMHKSLSSGPTGESLLVYLARVKAVLDGLGATWVTGTLSEFKRHAGGHLYFTLVQTDDAGDVQAKCRGVIWRAAAGPIEQRFRAGTGLSLDNNQDVMLKVRAQAHPVHGFSLVVEDIHPDFTVGRLAARLAQIRDALKVAGVFDRNRQLGLPSDFFRVAVLSPADAAGLGDFRSRADRLATAGVVQFVYFTAIFQGPQTAATMTQALAAIAAVHAGNPLDAVVIIRGGGSEWDLASLNELAIARAVCELPIPVLCGIGHERDNTIVDEVACKRLPTPSMVIDFIESVIVTRLQRMLDNWASIRQSANRQVTLAQQRVAQQVQTVRDQALSLCRRADDTLLHARQRLGDGARSNRQQAAIAIAQAQQTVQDSARRELALRTQAIAQLRHDTLPLAARQRLEWSNVRLQSHADYILSQDPLRILQRGYAMLLDAAGQPVPALANARLQTGLRLRLRDGEAPVQLMNDTSGNESP